jgi:hypothetical protein
MPTKTVRLTPADVTFLPFKERISLLRRDPALRALERLLLSKGGERVAFLPDADAQAIVERGELFDGNDVRVVKGEPRRCHANVGTLWLRSRRKGISIATGWALSQAVGGSTRGDSQAMWGRADRAEGALHRHRARPHRVADFLLSNCQQLSNWILARVPDMLANYARVRQCISGLFPEQELVTATL